MESSIVSNKNDSTLKPEHTVSVHELALHAMRDRCLLLQRRISTLESDNMRLKMDISKADATHYIPLDETEKVQLNKKITQLSKEKSQLLHHVFMVSCENRNLWSKIANINKNDKPKPLLRTNTYIQSTPKNTAADKLTETSLEEISLQIIQGKSQLVEQYEKISKLQQEIDTINVDSVGFTYIDEPPTDSMKELFELTETLHTLKKELEQQADDMDFVLSQFEKFAREGYKCPTCIQKNTKITLENKEIETSDSLANFATPVDSSSYNENNVIQHSTAKTETLRTMAATNEEYTGICPMCSKTFNQDTAFPEFVAHVQQHFTGDSEQDSVVDNFEFLHNSSVDNV